MTYRSSRAQVYCFEATICLLTSERLCWRFVMIFRYVDVSLVTCEPRFIDDWMTDQREAAVRTILFGIYTCSHERESCAGNRADTLRTRKCFGSQFYHCVIYLWCGYWQQQRSWYHFPLDPAMPTRKKGFVQTSVVAANVLIEASKMNNSKKQ